MVLGSGFWAPTKVLFIIKSISGLHDNNQVTATKKKHMSTFLDLFATNGVFFICEIRYKSKAKRSVGSLGFACNILNLILQC